MTRALFVQAMVKFFSGVMALGLLLFLSAGTLHYPAGWLLMLVLFVPMFLAGIVMMLKSPELLAKRLNMKEKMGDQVQVVALSAMMFTLGFALAGLSFRFGLLMLPEWVSWAACVLFLAAYALYAQVLRENAFLSRTIEIQEGQHVVDTGLYGVMHHPMYSATILLFLSMPLILRSLAAFAVFMAYPLIIAKRIRGEEEFLVAHLEGYNEYMQKVRWKLIPFIW